MCLVNEARLISGRKDRTKQTKVFSDRNKLKDACRKTHV